MKVGLVCSSGGHLAQLAQLSGWWEQHDRFWVTFDKPDSREILAGERVYWAHSPTNRDLGALALNARLARRVLRRECPELLVSNGAGVALPFFAWGRLHAVRLVYVEVPDRVSGPSLTGRLLYPWVDRMVLTHPAQRVFYPDGLLFGETA